MSDRLTERSRLPFSTVTTVSNSTAIEVEGLTCRYGDRTAVAELSFSVPANEVFALLGPNGGGKTTVFKVLATLLFPTAGSVRVFNRDIRREPDAIRKDIGLVFQSPSLDRKLTVRENLTHQGHLYGWRGKELRARIQELLARFGVADRGDEIVERLSGGLARRVELAKGFLHRPRLLLLDEPSAGLDPGARRDFWEYLLDLKKAEGVTIVLTTHLMDEAERCDRLAILRHGQLVALGSPVSLKEAIGGDVVILQTMNPERLQQQIQDRFHVQATILDGTVRVERAQGHTFVAAVMESFPGEIQAATVAKPTLEDVFIHQTGHKFQNGS